MQRSERSLVIVAGGLFAVIAVVAILLQPAPEPSASTTQPITSPSVPGEPSLSRAARLAPVARGIEEAAAPDPVERRAVEAATSAAAAAPDPAGEPLELDPILPARIEGTVTSRGEAYPGAVVRLVELTEDGARPLDGRLAITDPEGGFDLGARPPASRFPRVAALVLADGYVPASAVVPPFGAERLDVALRSGSSIPVVVEDRDGNRLPEMLVAIDDHRHLSRWSSKASRLSRAHAHFLATGGLPANRELPVARTNGDGEVAFGGVPAGTSCDLTLLDPIHSGWTRGYAGHSERRIRARPEGVAILLSTRSAEDGRPPILAVRDVRLIGVDGDGRSREWELFDRGHDAEGLRSSLGWLDVRLEPSELRDLLASGELSDVHLVLDANLDARPWRRLVLPLEGGGPVPGSDTAALYAFAPIGPDPADRMPTGRLRLRLSNATGGAVDGGVLARARYGETVLDLAPWRYTESLFEVDLRSGEGHLEVYLAHAPETWPPVATRVMPGFEDSPMDLVLAGPGSLTVERPPDLEGSWTLLLWPGGGAASEDEALRRLTTVAPSVVIPALPEGEWTVQWKRGPEESLDLQTVTVAPGSNATASAISAEPASAPPSDG